MCRVQRDSSLIAARYIKISKSSGGSGIEIKLYLTTDDDIGRPYCALSHCWGGASDILILRTSNIEELKVGIDIETLAKSFRDAVTITHAIGIEYLWIDCLCIIQDSKQDWLQESMRMGHIYEGVTCTIMAAASRDPHGGLFQTRNPLTYSPFRLCGSESDESFVMPYGSKGKLDEVLKDAALQKRAWTFQESYLSPRKLYFGPNGIYWSCFKGEATEMDPNGRTKREGNAPRFSQMETIFGSAVLVEKPKIPADRPFMLDNNLIVSITHGHRFADENILPGDNEVAVEGHFSMNGKPPRESPLIVENTRFWRTETSGSDLSHDDFHSEWFQVVGEYSGRALTKLEDKLIALSGIATRISDDTGYHYMAGLWEETLLLDLLWHIDAQSYSEPLKPRVSNDIAPSWSWASVEGPVKSSFIQPDLATVPLVEVKLENPSARTSNTALGLGNLDTRALVLKGKLKRVSAVRAEHDTITRAAQIYVGERELGRIEYDVLLSSLAKTYILPILEDTDWSSSHYPAIRGLALVWKGDHYERVGLFSCTLLSRRDKLADYEWFHEGEAQDVHIA
jgi:hypothetical protein